MSTLNLADNQCVIKSTDQILTGAFMLSDLSIDAVFFVKAMIKE